MERYIESQQKLFSPENIDDNNNKKVGYLSYQKFNEVSCI